MNTTEWIAMMIILGAASGLARFPHRLLGTAGGGADRHRHPAGAGVLGKVFPDYYGTVAFAPPVIGALNGIAWWAVMVFVWIADCRAIRN